MEENGYRDIQKTITKDLYSVSGVSSFGSKITELWDAVRNLHILKTENTIGGQKNVNELVRENLNGVSRDFYCRATTDAPGYSVTYLYSDSPKMIYKRFFDKVLHTVQYSKKIGDGAWEPLFRKPAPVIKGNWQKGLRIRHSVTENDGSVSTYLLNPKTQCLYKRNVATNGNTQYYKVTPNGVINLFNR